MVIVSSSAETELRHIFNRRVLFCIRIRGAALLIGLWDLLIHSVALCMLIYLFRHGSNGSTNLIASEGATIRQSPIPLINGLHVEKSSNDVLQNKNFLSSNILLNRILEKRNVSQAPAGLNARHLYSNVDLLTMRWATSMKQQDRCIVFFIIFSATILILAHICGILTNKPSYIVPYFLIKVFNIIVSTLSMMGFYAYMPDIKVWLRVQPDFPLKSNLLDLDAQTLQLVVFAFLLCVILAKLYIAAIIWYCYSYITALNMVRSIGIHANTVSSSRSITGEMYSPPKYEEAIRLNAHEQENYAPPPYTPLLQGSA